MDITTLMTHRISTYATETDSSVESKVGEDILLLLRLSGNALVLLLCKHKQTQDLFSSIGLCFLQLIQLSRLDFTTFPTSKSFIQSLHFALNGSPSFLKYVTYIFPFVTSQLGKIILTSYTFLFYYKRQAVSNENLGHVCMRFHFASK